MGLLDRVLRETRTGGTHGGLLRRVQTLSPPTEEPAPRDGSLILPARPPLSGPPRTAHPAE